MSENLTNQESVEDDKNFDFSEEEPENEIVLNPIININERKLHTQAYDKSISDLVSKIEEQDIILNPQYQRNYVWDNRKASLLIESILLNVPIPVLYMAEDEESRWNVVDGLQRLYSLKRFFKDEFKLSNLEVLQELNGKKYSQLSGEKAGRILRNGIIRTVVISQDSHHEIKYDIFMRLNTGSIKLNEQELRNCLYRGNLNELLKEIRKNEKFMKMIGISAPHKRLIDAEIILRYLAISENYNREKGEVENYSGQMKVFLNNYMNKYQNTNENFIEKIKLKFEESIDKVYEIFGDRAFQKINQDGNVEPRLNRAIHDCLMISFEDKEKEYLLDNKEKIIDGFKNLIKENNDFYDSISSWTSDKNKLNFRLKTWCDNIEEIIS